MLRKRIFIAVVVGLFSLASEARAATGSFVVLSFNTLHYGWGGNTATAAKDAAIVAARNDTGANAIVLQEIMPNATFNGLQPPNSIDFVLADQNYGRGSYRERYLVILDAAKFTFVQKLEYPQLVTSFSRPPMAVAVTPQGSANNYAIADFHAIWGKSQAQRAAEAAAICTAWQPQVGTTSIALAGDWNLTAQQVAQSAGCLSLVNPTALTTLNRGGTGYSSSYDHAVVFGNGGGLKMTKAGVESPSSTTTWRQTVSDHIPIYAVYDYN